MLRRPAPEDDGDAGTGVGDRAHGPGRLAVPPRLPRVEPTPDAPLAPQTRLVHLGRPARDGRGAAQPAGRAVHDAARGHRRGRRRPVGRRQLRPLRACPRGRRWRTRSATSRAGRPSCCRQRDRRGRRRGAGRPRRAVGSRTGARSSSPPRTATPAPSGCSRTCGPPAASSWCSVDPADTDAILAAVAGRRPAVGREPGQPDDGDHRPGRRVRGRPPRRRPLASSTARTPPRCCRTRSRSAPTSSCTPSPSRSPGTPTSSWAPPSPPTRASPRALHDHRTRSGAVPGPFEAWLALRGLRTLDVRLQRAQENAQVLAERLLEHPAVQRVRYPGLPTDPGHEVAMRQMRGPGTMLAIDLAGTREAETLAAAVRVWTHATSLGGVESLLERRRRHPGEVTDRPRRPGPAVGRHRARRRPVGRPVAGARPGRRPTS